MSIPVDLCNDWSEEIYGNEEMYQSSEHGISRSPRPELSHSVFQCAVEDHRTSTHDTEDSTSDSGIDSDIVVFSPDVELDTPDEYEYHLLYYQFATTCTCKGRDIDSRNTIIYFELFTGAPTR